MSFAYESEGVVSEERGAGMFLAHLPSDTPVYCYNNKLALESLFPPYSVEDRFIVLKNFPPETLAEHEEDLPGRCDYSPSLQILIITMPGLPHEEAADSFQIIIATLAKEMKVYRRLANWGATRVDTPDRSKQADRSWGPRGQMRDFPTVTLETGFSETTSKLEKDIAWWINGSQGDVRMGVTVDIKRASGSIEIRSWTPVFTPLPSHVQITASGRRVVDRDISNPPPPRVAQRIFIKRGRDGSRPTIEGGDLTIPFDALLLDKPGEDEHDFVLTADMLLHDLAERVWDASDLAEAKKAKKKTR
ncbi:uncharacterized protein N7482_010694 [Penicillium canariense]|uniref:Uncharacterized protein n=1 Tax=Penicillium canariense TaxID=189055 RepID=A0A9W9HL44_9EURO|nr:uncharacterized protein N7482_010694 [Penicillium canariense]KAJ5151442.1 hypothetical protein N7482_010694 [Penicillium canariense]